jgi:hypothetical protein
VEPYKYPVQLFNYEICSLTTVTLRIKIQEKQVWEVSFAAYHKNDNELNFRKLKMRGR